MGSLRSWVDIVMVNTHACEIQKVRKVMAGLSQHEKRELLILRSRHSQYLWGKYTCECSWWSRCELLLSLHGILTDPEQEPLTGVRGPSQQRLGRWPAVGQGPEVEYKCIWMCQGNLRWKNPYDGGGRKRYWGHFQKPIRMANETESAANLCQSQKAQIPVHSNIY